MSWNDKSMLSQLLESNEPRTKEAINYFQQYPNPEAVVPLLRVAAGKEEAVWRATDNGELTNTTKDEPLCTYAHAAVQNIDSIEELKKALVDRDPDVRAQAAWAMGSKDDEQTAESLLKALQDPETAVVLQVIRALDKRGLSSLEPVLQYLNSPDATLRWAALQAVGGSFDPRAANILTLIMTSDQRSDTTRAMAAKLLGSHRDRMAAGALISMLKESSPTLRQQAALSLGLIGAKSAETPIFHLLIDEDENVRFAASIALGLLGDTRVVPNLLRARRHGDMRNQNLAEETLRGLGTRAIEGFVQAMRNDLMPYRADATDFISELKTPRATLALIESMLDEEIFTNARQALLALGKPAIKPLIYVAGNQEAPIIFQEKCIRLLADMNATEAAPILIKQLKSKEASIRALSARVLGKFAEKKAVKPLLAILKKGDKEPDLVLAEASLALGTLGASSATAILVGQLEHPNSKVRGYSISALGEMKSKEAVEPLVKLVLDPEQDNRTMMIQALANIGDAKAVPALKIILDEVREDMARRDSNYLGSYVVQGLAKLGEGSVIQLLLSEWEEELEPAVLALGERALPYLESALAEERNAHSRALAAEAIGIVGSPLALGALIQALQDDSDVVRTAAARSLNQVHSSQALLGAT